SYLSLYRPPTPPISTLSLHDALPISYIPGLVPLTPANGVYPDPGGLSYFGANPLQTTALGTNDETALRFVGGLTATFQPVQSARSEEHTSELQSRGHLVCRLLLEKKK